MVFNLEFCIRICLSFLSMIGTGTVSNWYNINGCCVYDCMKIGNCTIKFLFLSIPKVTNFIS